MDVIAMHQAGFTNAIAGCGTALTNEQVRLVSRYAKEVILAYDADEAGQKALNKAITLFKQTDIKIKVPSLVGGKDPDEIIKKYGAEKFAGMLEGASNEIEFYLFDLRKKYNLNTTNGKIEFLSEAIKVLVDTSPIEQDLYLSRLSSELSVDKGSIKLQLDELIKKDKQKKKKQESRSVVDNIINEDRKLSMQANSSIKKLKAEYRAIELLLLYPACAKLCENFDLSILSDGFVRKVFSLIVERIGNHLDIDLINLSGFLTESEMSSLSKLVAKRQLSVNSKNEFNDCLKTIISENENSEATSSIDNDDNFRNLFKKK